MLNIVIPMAGAGSRFAMAGYKLPKPLISIHGKPMIEIVVENLKPQMKHRFIFICRKSHEMKFGISELLRKIAPLSEIIFVDEITQGAAETVLMAKEQINNDDPLMIANSDQLIDFSIDRYLHDVSERDLDGFIMCMESASSKWSYLRFDRNNLIQEVVEKEVVSNQATVGVYNFRHGSSFVKHAYEMIKLDKRVNNEFYVAPVYTEMISSGGIVGFTNIGKEYDKMIGLGIPSDLEDFLNRSMSEYIESLFK